MSDSDLIAELIIAIGYSLDAGNPDRDYEDRKECRDIAEKILQKCIKEIKDRKKECSP